jgi:hypothetical protein
MHHRNVVNLRRGEKVPPAISVLGFFHVHQVNACLVDQGSRLKSPLGDFLAIFGQTATFVPEKVHMVTNARMREKYRCASMKRGISPRLIPAVGDPCNRMPQNRGKFAI